MRRHWAFMSATESMGLSSMRMRVLLSSPTVWATRRSSLSVTVARWSFSLGSMAAPEIRREANCSRLISREKTATVFRVLRATCRAMFRAMELLPMPGREATRISSPGFMPRMQLSRS